MTFISGHVLEKYPKMKFRVKQRVRCLQHIPFLLIIRIFAIVNRYLLQLGTNFFGNVMAKLS